MLGDVLHVISRLSLIGNDRNDMESLFLLNKSQKIGKAYRNQIVAKLLEALIQLKKVFR